MTAMTLARPRGTPAPRVVPTGIAFAVTVAIFYTLCTLVWVVAPGPFIAFMNALFHGMDFTPLLPAGPFSFSGFVEALLVLTAWAFAAATFFAWLRERIDI